MGITAKSASDGKINLRTQNPVQFRKIQKILFDNQISFHTRTLAEDKFLESSSKETESASQMRI